MPRILLVEDNELNRDMLTRRLQRRGMQVDAAVDGAAGVAAALRLQPDLILLDMSLPVLDGWAAAQRIRGDAATRHIPIIALTAHAMADDRARALAAGCDDFDTKPVELPRLLAKIEALLAAAPWSPVDELELPSAGLADLARIRDFVATCCRTAGADDATVDALVQSTDEVCANVLQHGYVATGSGPLHVTVTQREGVLRVIVRDAAPLFDPAAAPRPSIDDPVEQRQIGGLGWHLVRRLTEHVRWEPAADGGNVVVLERRARDALAAPLSSG